MQIMIRQWIDPFKRSATAKRNNLIAKTINEVSDLIMTDDVKASILEVEVRLLYRMKKTQMGSCTVKSPGKYVISLKATLEEDDFVSTLAHEVAHMNQFAEGRLISSSTHFLWGIPDGVMNPKRYNAQEYTHEEYLNWPWEREARSIEASYMAILSARKK